MKKKSIRALMLRLSALGTAVLMALLLASPALASPTDEPDVSSADAQTAYSTDPTYIALLEDSGILSGTDVEMLRFAAGRKRIEPYNRSDDLYFDTWSVLMRVHRNRSIDITEKFDVYFNEEMHGMTRTLPAYSSAEAFEIRDMEVVGSPYHYSSDTIYIGSSDVTVTGMQHYTIKYTIANFDDSYDGYDRLYRDIVGSEVQNPVYNVIGCVVLDDGMTFDEVTLYSGRYGYTENEYIESFDSANKLLVYNTKELGSYNAVTLDAKLPEGSYSEPALLQPDYIVDNLDVKASIDKYGYMHVDESYDITLLADGSRSFYRELPTPEDSSMDRKIEHLTLTKNGIVHSDSRDNYSVGCVFNSDEGDTAHVDVSYDVKYLVRSDKTDKRLKLPLITYTDAMCKYKNVSFELKTPFDLDTQLDHAVIFTGNYDNYTSYQDSTYDAKYYFVTETSGDTITSRLEGSEMSIGETATVDLGFVKNALERKPIITDYILSILGLLGLGGLAAGSFSKKSREKQLIPSVQYYPPAGLNPAEIGFIIDNECESRDVTSLIYYWASKGFLTIEMPGKGSGFTLHKLRPLTDDHRDYEKALFNKMFNLGSGTTVKDSQLSTKLYTDVNSAASKVKNVFTGNQRFFTSASDAASKILPIAVPVIAWFGSIVAAQVWGGSDSASSLLFFGGIIAAVIAVFKRRSYVRRYKDKTGKSVFGTVFRLAVLALAFMIMISSGGGAISYIAAAALTALVLVNSIVSPQMLTRTDFYTDLLGLVVGFKEFLETAEKDRLKMLLEDNPSYYYDILPYAQVLGVSKQWASRFDGLTMQAPAWFFGPSVTPYTFNSMLDRNMTRMNNSMTSVPASSGGGGGFSGGSFGGGFSGGGGGFSGGGGGGGAGGW